MSFSEGGECGSGGKLLDHLPRMDLQELKSRQWQPTDWKPKDAYISRKSGRPVWTSEPSLDEVREVVPGGWDHDHCDICWWKLDASGDPDRSNGFSDGSYGWLCRKCHDSLVRWTG